jgi:hypothetical protein
MSKRPLDFLFERDGPSLSAWLLKLVAEDASARLAASEALQTMESQPQVCQNYDSYWAQYLPRMERLAYRRLIHVYVTML